MATGLHATTTGRWGWRLLVLSVLWLAGLAPALASPVPRLWVGDLHTGQPLDAALVSGPGWAVRTDVSGWAEVPGLAQGDPLWIRAAYHTPAEVAFSDQAESYILLRPKVIEGQVLDATTGQPVKGALVYVGDRVLDANIWGRFRVEPWPETAGLVVKAAGYEKAYLTPGPGLSWAEPVSGLPPRLVVRLVPFEVHGLYIPFGLLKVADRVKDLIDLVDRSEELNAIVIDVKGDRGWLAYASQVSLALELGVSGPFEGWMRLEEVLALCQKKDIYTVARIVAFKDDPLAHTRPDLAVVSQTGEVWHDGEKLGWGNPFRDEVQQYAVDLAVEIASLGFDEIQFDYVRFPSDGNLSAIAYAEENTAATRTAALRAFMRRVQRALRPTGVFTSADLFGLTVWVGHSEDMGIGQRVDDIAPFVDYVCPMVYPSTFAPGTLGLPVPWEHPYDIVYQSQLRAARRVPMPTRVRPWLQHYSLYGVTYGPEQLRLQRQAAEDAGAAGWCFWNAGGRYDAEFFAPTNVQGD